MLEITLPHDLERRLDAAAKRAGTSVSNIARDAILERLDDLEDIARAAQALDDIRGGHGSTSSLDEVERRLGLAD